LIESCLTDSIYTVFAESAGNRLANRFIIFNSEQGPFDLDCAETATAASAKHSGNQRLAGPYSAAGKVRAIFDLGRAMFVTTPASHHAPDRRPRRNHRDSQKARCVMLGRARRRGSRTI